MLDFKIWAFLAIVFARFSKSGRSREDADDSAGSDTASSGVVSDTTTAMPDAGANDDIAGDTGAGNGGADGDTDTGAGSTPVPVDPMPGFMLTQAQIMGYQTAQGAVNGVANFIDGNIGDLTISIGTLTGAEFTAAIVDPAARTAAMNAVADLSAGASEEDAVAAAEAITGLVVANRIAIAENFAQILNIPLEDLLTIAATVEADVAAGLGMPEGLSPAEQAVFDLIVAVQTNGTIVAALLNEANVTFDLELAPFAYDAPALPEILSLDSLLETATASVAAVGALAVPAVANLQAIVDQALLDSGQNENDAMAGGNGDDTMAGGNGDDTMAGGNGDDTMAGGNGDDTMAGGNGDDTMAGGNGDDTMAGGDHPGVDGDTAAGDTTPGVLDPIIADDGLLGEVTGNDGLLGEVTGADGLLGDLIGNDGALADVTGSDGLVGDLLGTGLLGDDPIMTEEAGILDPIIADDGLLGSVTGNDGLLGEVTGADGLLGDLIGNDGALADVTGSDGLVGDLLGTGLLGDDPIMAEEAGILDPIIADDGLLGSVTGSDGLLGALFQPRTIETTGNDPVLLSDAEEEEDLLNDSLI